MSIDKSLKKGVGLTRSRNVLTRAERLALLQEEDRWRPEKGVFNLPKTKSPAGARSVGPEAARRYGEGVTAGPPRDPAVRKDSPLADWPGVFYFVPWSG